MEKIVSILSLLEKDKELVEKLNDIQKNVVRYRDELKSSLEAVQRNLKYELNAAERCDSWIAKLKERIQHNENDLKNKTLTFNGDNGEIKIFDLSQFNDNGILDDDFINKQLERLKEENKRDEVSLNETTLELAEHTEKIGKLQYFLTASQNKLDMSNDELISLEVNELKKQLAEVRAEISKQLNLKVWDLHALYTLENCDDIWKSTI